jgi:hypothetical protein
MGSGERAWGCCRQIDSISFLRVRFGSEESDQEGAIPALGVDRGEMLWARLGLANLAHWSFDAQTRCSYWSCARILWLVNSVKLQLACEKW